MNHLESRLGGEPLGLLVEHDEARLAVGSVTFDEVDDLLVTEEVVTDLLHGGELARVTLAGDEHPGVSALVRVEVRDVVEVLHPAVEPQRLNAVGEMK